MPPMRIPSFSISPPRLSDYWVIVFMSLVATVGTCIAQSTGAAVCSDTTIAGRVTHGERFESTFADGLRFVLDPSIGAPNPDGWTIRVEGKQTDHDFLMIATPPYRFSNPRYLDTSYGNSAEQAAARRERSFSFVLTEEDYERMSEAVGVLLWPADRDSTEIAAAWDVTETIPKGRGVFRILESETSPAGESAPQGRIERITFAIDLCWDEQFLAPR